MGRLDPEELPGLGLFELLRQPDLDQRVVRRIALVGGGLQPGEKRLRQAQGDGSGRQFQLRENRAYFVDMYIWQGVFLEEAGGAMPMTPGMRVWTTQPTNNCC